MKYAFINFLLLFTVLAGAQTVTLSGTAKDFSGDSIEILKYTDFITYNTEVLNYITPDKSGNFSVDIKVDDITFIYMYMGIYKAEMYVEPGKDYIIDLPPKKEKTTADELNPYFRYEEALIGVMSPKKDMLNINIRMFDDIYEKYLKDNFSDLYHNRMKPDSFYVFIKKIFVDYDNEFFNNYVKYRMIELAFIGSARNYKVISEYYYKNKPILYNNFAYMELFNNLFQDFLYYYAFETKGKDIRSNIDKAKSIKKLKRTLSKEIAFDNDTLQELIVLKGIHDALLDNVPKTFTKYGKAQLYQTLDSIMILTKIPEHRVIGNNIIAKFNPKNNLINGDKIPNIALYDQDSIKTDLSFYEDKYVYLCITMTNCVPCQKDMEMMQVLKNKFSAQLDFVTIVINGNISDMRKFREEKGYDWDFLHYGYNKKIREIFYAEVIPKYMLIDPYGRIIMTSAPTPDKLKNTLRKILN